jgi:hypothetical protein
MIPKRFDLHGTSHGASFYTGMSIWMTFSMIHLQKREQYLDPGEEQNTGQTNICAIYPSRGARIQRLIQ